MQGTVPMRTLTRCSEHREQLTRAVLQELRSELHLSVLTALTPPVHRSAPGSSSPLRFVKSLGSFKLDLSCNQLVQCMGIPSRSWEQGGAMHSEFPS